MRYARWQTIEMIFPWLANRVGRRCSNPKCQKLTCAANTDPDKITNIGVAAIFVPQQRVVQDMMKV